MDIVLCPVCAEKGVERVMKKIGTTGYYEVWWCACGNESLREMEVANE